MNTTTTRAKTNIHHTASNKLRRNYRDLKKLGSLPAPPLPSQCRPPIDHHSGGEEVLEISGIQIDPSLQAHWEAYLFYPSADASTPVSCPEFVGTFNHIPHVGQAQLKNKLEWRVAVRTKLESLGKQNYSDVVVTLAQFGPSMQSLGIARARIVWDTSPGNSTSQMV